MTDRPEAHTVDHTRRAATLLVHHARRDVAGVNDVIQQVREDDNPAESTTALIFAVVQVFEGVVPMLFTDTGIRLLSTVVLDLAGLDDQ